MSTVLVREVKCDVCGAGDAELVFYQLADGGKYAIDLCRKHRQPVYDLIENSRPGRPRRARSGDNIVVTQPRKRTAKVKAT